MDIYHVGINSGEYEEAFTPKFETYVTGEEAAKKLVAKLKRIAKKKEKTNRYSYLKYDEGTPSWWVWMIKITPDNPQLEDDLKRYAKND